METSTENAFETLLKSFGTKQGITKVELLTLIDNGLLDHENALIRLFECGNIHAVCQDENEFHVAESFLMERGGNGHYYNSLRKDLFQKGLWVRMYKRPHDLTIPKAFALAQTFKDENGRVVLPEEDARLYRHVPVGGAGRNMTVTTFIEFCKNINQFLTKEDTA